MTYFYKGAIELFLVIALFCVGMSDQSYAQTQKRIALLIGNGAYKEVSILPNPKRDVALIGKVFQDAGFDIVNISLDLDRSMMLKAIRTFEDRVQGSDIGVIYYAGHGIEVNGQNYLIPTDARLASDKDVEDEAISLERLIKALGSGLIDQSQKMTVAAMQIADMKVWAHLS